MVLALPHSPQGRRCWLCTAHYALLPQSALRYDYDDDDQAQAQALWLAQFNVRACHCLLLLFLRSPPCSDPMCMHTPYV
jgi:hypothetical protein